MACLIRHCSLHQSRHLWIISSEAELSEFVMFGDGLTGPDRWAVAAASARRFHGQEPAVGWDVFIAIMFVVIIADARPGQIRACMGEEQFDNVNMEIVVRLAALINCGIGVHAFEWSLKNMVPVLVDFHGKDFLALVPNSVMNAVADYDFVIVKAGKNWKGTDRYALFAVDRKLGPKRYRTCLFPPDIEFDRRHNRIEWVM